MTLSQDAGVRKLTLVAKLPVLQTVMTFSPSPLPPLPITCSINQAAPYCIHAQHGLATISKTTRAH
jgi:hypothetical protein